MVVVVLAQISLRAKCFAPQREASELGGLQKPARIHPNSSETSCQLDGLVGRPDSFELAPVVCA